MCENCNEYCSDMQFGFHPDPATFDTRKELRPCSLKYSYLLMMY